MKVGRLKKYGQSGREPFGSGPRGRAVRGEGDFEAHVEGGCTSFEKREEVCDVPAGEEGGDRVQDNFQKLPER